MARAIGIDLGTTYTVVATLENGRPRVIPNAQGQHLTPSVVAFTPEGIPLVGQPAKSQAVANPTRTISSIKRHMGSDYLVRIGDREYTPVEISTLILRQVKADAEAYLGERIEKAVITVPAYFNDLQRQATRQAGLLAGLDVTRILSEPTATALAYGLQREEVHTVLVWDLGGGTFDVSILDLGEGIFEVRAVSGDTWLGGDDYDQRLADYLAQEYGRACPEPSALRASARRLVEGAWGVPFPRDAGLRQRLREAAERAKIELSSSPLARVSLSLAEGRPWELEVTREQFEALTADLLQRMVTPAQQALRDAGLMPQDIDRVVLAGGATRMPALRRLVREMFGKEPYRYLDPDEVVALGSAIEAGMLLGLVDRAVLLDVLPLSLGVETQGGLVARIIPRNTPLPATAGQVFTTAADYQTSMDIHVLQGERELVSDNVSLGRFRLDDIPSALRGTPKVEVAFEADVDGIIHVSAVDLLSGHEVKVQLAAKLLDPQEIRCLAEEAQRRAAQDRDRRERIQAGIEAHSALAAAELVLAQAPTSRENREALDRAMEQLREAVGGSDTEGMKYRSQELRRWLVSHGKA